MTEIMDNRRKLLPTHFNFFAENILLEAHRALFIKAKINARQHVSVLFVEIV